MPDTVADCIRKAMDEGGDPDSIAAALQEKGFLAEGAEVNPLSGDKPAESDPGDGPGEPEFPASKREGDDDDDDDDDKPMSRRKKLDAGYLKSMKKFGKE